MYSNEIAQNYGNTTTISAGLASSTVAVLTGGDGSAAKRYLLRTLSGGAHVKFGASSVAATDDDLLVTPNGVAMYVPANGATHIAAIAANAVTSVLNIAVLNP